VFKKQKTGSHLPIALKGDEKDEKFSGIGPEGDMGEERTPGQEVRSRRRFCHKIGQFAVPNPPTVPEGTKSLGTCTQCGGHCVVLGAYGGE